MRHSLTTLLFALLAFGVACAKSPEGEEKAEAPSEFRESSSRGDSGTIASTRVAELQTVYFDYDQSVIRSDARPVLRANKQAIDDSNWDRIVLEGHCDERGSEEYNLALGERRANAVKQYLQSLGVPGSKIQTVSYGESRPAAFGSNESAWSQNRRVEFGVGR